MAVCHSNLGDKLIVEKGERKQSENREDRYVPARRRYRWAKETQAVEQLRNVLRNSVGNIHKFPDP